MVTDPHQLVLRLSQLLQEMCELLKVRLLAEVLSSPTVSQSHNFAKSEYKNYCLLSSFSIINKLVEILLFFAAFIHFAF
jgi:hypothetical protein